MIGDRMLALQADTRAPSRVVPLERATPATAPVEAIPFVRFALAAAVSLFLPFALAVTWEKVVRRVGDSVQLRRDTHLRVIGEIAALPTRPQVAQGAARGPARRDISLFEESIDSLRTSLVLSEDIGDLQVIAVTSAISGEGKTSLASQLALSISRASGEPTLLIDADMRSPDIHKVFQVAQEPGLAQVLDRQCSAQDAIVTGWSRNLHILPAGKLGKSPHKLLGAGALSSVLDELRATYRYIIIDTPPVLSASESLVFCKAAEGVLVCTMRDVSRVRQVKLACDRLVAANARPIGAVLNGVPTNHYAYTYGTYSYRRA
jgi:capsular exopolysaccharide synthesis family protein